MAGDEVKPGKFTPKSTLIQTKLPSAFFAPSKSGHTAIKSPYFSSSTNTTTPTAALTGAATLSAITFTPPDIAKYSNLYPERRSQLARQPPPSLPSSSTGSRLLAAVASETKSLLPTLLASAPHAAPSGYLFNANNLPSLSPHDCPSVLLPSTTTTTTTRVRVLNGDSLDTALALSKTKKKVSPSPPPPPSSKEEEEEEDGRILVLNMANAQHGGGGWLKGALAQEEAICYRSSLSFTLKRRYYPIPDFGGIYSPSVLVMRESLAGGHHLLDLSDPASLPVVSVVSVAAVRDPDVIGGQGEAGRYKYGKVRLVMKEKMRVVLRIAAGMGHRSLVLGALGCGAFGNPRGEVVMCWKEVLTEREFSGGWWKEVVFAVMEEGGQKDGEGNYGVFWRELDGLEI